MAKFKKGDKVRVLVDDFARAGDPRAGEIAVVAEDDNTVPWLKMSDGRKAASKESNLALVVEEKQNYKFKVGDKVKVKRPCSNCKVGEVYTLYYGYTDGAYLEELCARHKDSGPDVGCGCESNWELVTEQLSEQPHKFKVGDTVIGNDPDRYGTTKLGWKGKVQEVKEDGTFKAGDFYWLEPQYFDLVKEETTTYETITPKVGEKYQVIKKLGMVFFNGVGDVIVYKGNQRWSSPGKSYGQSISSEESIKKYLTTEYLKPLGKSYTTPGLHVVANAYTAPRPHVVEPMAFTSAEIESIAKGPVVKTGPIKKTNIITKSMNAFKKAMLSAETKALIKAGFLDEDDLTLTSRGKEAQDFILFEANKAELVKAAEAVIKEEEARRAK